ncbi:hypothetical protein H8356DRAFT_953851 [Neocallimastix lanati (nom. inval.)]|nr:hypothetical protein H8356DRAFT_953851 [Neocallimastix sp. JGI-2020a]
MQRYALPKEINPKKEQLDNKHWRKNITKQSYLPTRSSSRASESSKTLINNNVQNKNNSFKKKNKSIPHSPSKRTFSNDIILKNHDLIPSKKNSDNEKKKDLTLEKYRKMLAKYEKLSVESLEKKPLNSSEDNTEFKEKAKLVSAIHNKTTEINDRNDTSHSIEQINDKSSRQFLMTSSNSKANLSPSFRTLDELQAKLQSTLEDEVQELTQEREKNKNIIYRMRERTTDLVTKNNELFNSKLKLKYELEFIKEQMEIKTQEMEKVIKERNIAQKQVDELRNELIEVKNENEKNENEEKKSYWGFKPFGF